MNPEKVKSPPEFSSKGEGQVVILLIEIQPELRSFIGHLMPIVDARADILQEVNLLLWEKRATFQPGTSFRNWAYTFARNVVMNHQKKAKREKRVVFSNEMVEQLAADFEESDPRLAERMPALRRCLSKIPKEERQLLLARYAKHGAIEQRAQESGRSAAALRGVIFRLRTALRSCIERELRESPTLP